MLPNCTKLPRGLTETTDRVIFDLPGRPLETKTPGKATENTGNQTGTRISFLKVLATLIQFFPALPPDVPVEVPGKSLEVKTTSLQCNIARAVIITDLQDTAVLLEEIDMFVLPASPCTILCPSDCGCIDLTQP